MKIHTLLLTARDTGAALQIGAIARQAQHHPRLNTIIYAADPADRVLSQMGLKVNSVKTPVIDTAFDKGAQALLSVADDILKQTRPDAVLTGLSGHGAGIDEAVIARARVPCFTFQDYWGDVNSLFGKIADCYFCLDHSGAELTRQRFRTDTCVSGSPKHAAFAQHDTMKLRNNARARFNLREDMLLIGLFGQPIRPHDQYLDVIEKFSRAVAKHARPNTLLYRPHPADTPDTQEKVLQILTDKELDPIVDTDRNVIETLCGCDLVCSAASSCNLDNIFLNYFSPAPLGISVYLFLNHAMEQIHAAQSGVTQPPPVDLDLAVKCSGVNDMAALFKAHKTEREIYWRNTKATLPPPDQAATTILARILRALS